MAPSKSSDEPLDSVSHKMLHSPLQMIILFIQFLKGKKTYFAELWSVRLSRYSLTSPYGHLYNTDSSFGPRKAKIIHSWISFRKADYSCKNSWGIASCQRKGLLNTLRMIWLIWLRAKAKQFLSKHKKALSNNKRNERNTCFCSIVTFKFRWTGQSSSY